MSEKKKVLIIGAGPAGLASGYMLSRDGIETVVCEKGDTVGGISRTVEKEGFRYDLGGHRFFTKNAEVFALVKNLLREELVRVPRTSKIYYRGRYFDYPLKPLNAFFGMGFLTSLKIIFDYGKEHARALFKKPRIISLEDWVVHKFGRTLFNLYFKTYTEKVWGIDCEKIEASWVAQRIKGLSLRVAIANSFFKSSQTRPTTLIENFYYPRDGIGRICERFREEIMKRDQSVILDCKVVKLIRKDFHIERVLTRTARGIRPLEATHFISSMPMTELVFFLDPLPPPEVLAAAKKLRYRDLIAVAIFLDKPRVSENTWVYIHDPSINFGRFHEPKNWSGRMSPPGKTSIVLEFFCFKDDEIWKKTDEQLRDLAVSELADKLKIIGRNELLGYHVTRVEKAYPMYETGFRPYYLSVKEYIGKFANLQIVGRYGTYKYNNMDHSIETGMKAAGNILGGFHDIDAVNREQEYHEEARD